jgi:hypothetical protein
MPPTRPRSSNTGLYEKVWYVSSGKPLRSRKRRRPSSQVARPVLRTVSIRGPISGQISRQTTSERAPSTQFRFTPTVGRYASLQKKVSSGPQHIHIA